MSLYLFSFVLAAVLPGKRGVDDEAALIARIARADRDALRRLYDKMAGQAFAVALRVLGSRSDAEDALQDGFVDVWTRSGSFDRGRGSGRTWVLSIIRNRAIDRLRTRGAIARMTDRAETEVTILSEKAPTPLEDVETRMARERVQTALGALSAEQRRVLELAYFEGLSHSEIAAKLGEPLGTIKSRVRAAMDKLEGMLPSEAQRGSA